jgi:DNA-binding transcriptional LysR family regulator
MNDASYIAQHLARAPQLMVASPDYLKAHGTPTRLTELANHNCLVHLIKAPTSIWRFTGPEGQASIRVRGSIASDFGEALMHAALDGQGISVHPYYMVSQYLQEGRLIAVLPDFEPDAHDIFVIYSSRQRLPERVRRFLSFLRDWARTPPQWSTPQSALAAAKSRHSPVLNSRQTTLRRPHVRRPLRSTEP